ncbi:MAG: cobalamin-dependent protein [Labilithrix sp.]|nr:cobalamin-dependent protein [Labilithrix sp.]MCW5814039.1 cobalamin-dependent protein [Labilithrix sp.]
MTARRDRPRALLVWPGGLFGGGANFGVPQILAMASAMKAAAGVDVDVVDLDIERAFGPVDLARLTAPGYDLVGIACYSSYDYLKVVELARRVRALLPKAWLVTGGYHASARPADFEGTAFDYVVVGDGEGPMARLASALETGRRPLLRVLGPEAVADPGKMPPVDWTLLDRYRPVARSVAAQAEIYLSRGCPYDCAFCMERAKRDTSWRALEPLQAVEEMHRLDRFLDLSRWTLFIADALFGMKTAWRRTFLEALAARPIRARKVWLLVRIDLLEREDIALMARANVAPGFGLESGDPEQVRRIRKVGRLSDYLDQMMRVAGWARELDVPWGANVIVGHPGETERSIRTTVKYLERLFLGPGGTTGFLSVDPFRLYPGSPIDEEFADWQASTGVRVKRYPWWHDGDQDFLSEWVDPSHDLDFRRCLALRHELFRPLVAGIAKAFCYGGPAPDYFRRAIAEQIDLVRPEKEARTLGLDRLWSTLLDDAEPARIEDDAAFARASRAARAELYGAEEDAVARALVEVPRERFVPIDALPEVHRDRALALDDSGLATVSAFHAYAAAFRALELGADDELVDLGGGSGYGAALAARVARAVTTIEIDPTLSAVARAQCPSNVHVVAGDAHDVALWRGARKVVAGFDVGAIPAAWLEALAPGGRLVAPAGGQLVVVDKDADGAIARRALGPVVYVRDRSERALQHEGADAHGR